MILQTYKVETKYCSHMYYYGQNVLRRVHVCSCLVQQNHLFCYNTVSANDIGALSAPSVLKTTHHSIELSWGTLHNETGRPKYHVKEKGFGIVYRYTLQNIDLD